MFDYFVLASGTSRRQLHAMSEEIDHALQHQMGDHRLGIEGYEESRWILLDYGDVVVHLFEPEMRAYYALEDLWGHAKRVPRKRAIEYASLPDGFCKEGRFRAALAGLVDDPAGLSGTDSPQPGPEVRRLPGQPGHAAGQTAAPARRAKWPPRS